MVPTTAISDRLCKHIAEFPTSAMPQSALDAAAKALLDGMGVIMAASGLSDEAAPFLTQAEESIPGPCRVLGTDIMCSPTSAALANGAMSHALDYEDAFELAPSHPNASLIPALLAVLQAGPPKERREVLAALAIGCDVACRIALSLEKPMEDGGWYPPPIIGGIGAVAGAARLLGLNAEQTRDAMSLMLCQLTCPGEIKNSKGTVIRAIREAFPAQAAVMSAQLARRGVAGFEQPLEGNSGFFALYVDGAFSEARLLENLGQTWWVEQLSFKPWPSCRGTHAFVQLALDLRNQPGFHWRNVERVDAHIGEVQDMLITPPDRKQSPSTAIDAKFSVPFTFATALVKGEVKLDSFTDTALKDDAVLSVSSRVGKIDRPDWDREFASAGGVRVIMKNGSVYATEVINPKGATTDPLSASELVEKFIDCTQRAKIPLKLQNAESMARALLEHERQPDLDGLLNQM